MCDFQAFDDMDLPYGVSVYSQKEVLDGTMGW
jgi:hypothetical protein